MLFQNIRCLALCIITAVMLLGCSYASVGHLQRQPWVLNMHQELEMRFWSFSYVAESVEGQYVVNGVAEPRSESLPDDLAWIEDLWLAAYLSDDRGRVLAQDLRVYSALPLDSGEGVSFSFVLRPDQLSRSAPLEITFGYNMTLTQGQEPVTQEHAPGDAVKRQPVGAKPGVFFAHEGALTRI